MTYVDVNESDLDDAADVAAARTNVLPLASYPHPDNGDLHRMEFELRVNAMIVKTALDRADIENFVA